MAQSLNSKVDLTIKATSFAGLSTNGNVMVGNKAFEFYNERNVEDCIQIPWDTIDRVEASVLFNKLLFCKWVVIVRLFTVFRAHCISISHFFWRQNCHFNKF